jgi:hypothetical protein
VIHLFLSIQPWAAVEVNAPLPAMGFVAHDKANKADYDRVDKVERE